MLIFNPNDFFSIAERPQTCPNHIFCFIKIAHRMTYVLTLYAGLHSFSISIFRYICIIHPQKLSDRNLTPEVRKSKALIFYLVLSYLIATVPNTVELFGRPKIVPYCQKFLILMK